MHFSSVCVVWELNTESLHLLGCATMITCKNWTKRTELLSFRGLVVVLLYVWPRERERERVRCVLLLHWLHWFTQWWECFCLTMLMRQGLIVCLAAFYTAPFSHYPGFCLPLSHSVISLIFALILVTSITYIMCLLKWEFGQTGRTGHQGAYKRV